MLPGRLRSTAVTATVLAVGALAACSPGSGAGQLPTTTPSSTSSSTSPSRPDPDGPITVGVYGPEEELTAWQAVVDSFNESGAGHRAKLVTWPDHQAAIADVSDGEAPDVFMSSRGDLGVLLEQDLVQPLGLLLDERGVDFGDRFSRDAVESFAVDDDLQCMAYSVSPMVLYYNTELVDLDRMERLGLDVPAKRERWSFEQFSAAARFATRGRGHVAGIHIDPTLRQLAPFVYSGGGSLYDDEQDPTSLALSEEDSREALDRTLSLLRDSTVTLTDHQLERRTPLEWFERGKLAMLAGFRDLVPRLRDSGVPFDVISMPVLDSTATVGDVRGLCMSSATDNVDDAADFISYAISDVAVERVVRTGYVVPANTSVAGSPVFLAPAHRPEHAKVFTDAIRGMVIPPLLEDYDALEEAVAPMLDEMLHRPGALDLERITTRIDRESRRVLADADVEVDEEE